MAKLGVTILTEGLENIDKILKFVDNIQNSNLGVNKYIKKKVIETYKDVVNSKFTGGTTDDEYISLYKKSFHIEDTDDGFILYNNAKKEVTEEDTSKPYQYPNGFSIAMAFEYGIGIVGYQNPVNGAWEYNKHKYEDGWEYPTDHSKYTSGYQGFQIFREIQKQVEEQYNNWIKEYYEKGSDN